MLSRLICVCLVSAALMSGCGGSEKPGSTATPGTASSTPAEATATRSAATATSVAVSPTQAPSATPPPTDTPVPSPTPSATSAPEPSAPPLAGAVTITAQRLSFVNASVVAKAGEVTVSLQNLDTSVPHDISIDALGVSVDCSGPCTASTTFTAAAGTYAFYCSYHPYMTGTLTVVP